MHAVLAFATVPLFLGAVLANWAYAASYQVQWTNFAAWLNAGGLALAGVALLWAAIALLWPRAGLHRRAALYLGLLLVSCVLGFFNALVHAMDAWAAMPTALVLSVVVLAGITAASVLGLIGARREVRA